MAQVRLARRAAKDLDRLPDRVAKKVLDALERLAVNPSGEGFDVKALVGRRPWRRLRVGGHRVLYRVADRQRVVLVARVVDRKDLDKAVATLPE